MQEPQLKKHILALVLRTFILTNLHEEAMGSPPIRVTILPKAAELLIFSIEDGGSIKESSCEACIAVRDTGLGRQ